MTPAYTKLTVAKRLVRLAEEQLSCNEQGKVIIFKNFTNALSAAKLKVYESKTKAKILKNKERKSHIIYGKGKFYLTLSRYFDVFVLNFKKAVTKIFY